MQNKNDAACLSELAIARLACGQGTATAAQSRHLTDCAFCRVRLTEETHQMQVSAQEALPPAIAALASGRQPAMRSGFASRLSRWHHGAAAVMALLVLAVTAHRIIELPKPHAHSGAVASDSGEHPKGSVQVVVAFKNAQGVVQPLDDLANLSALQPGDTVQVQVQAFDAAYATLVDADDHTIYFSGPITVGGWLPVGVEVTPDGPLRLSLKVCVQIPGTPCQTWELH